MTVKELMELLSAENPRAEVVLSKDGEGNSFSPACDYSVGFYVPESTWCGEFYPEKYSDEMDEDDKKIPALVLWPTN